MELKHSLDWGEASAVYDEILAFAKDRDLSVFNEAQTRFDILDRFIKELMQWSHGSIVVEEYDAGEKAGYVDYILKCLDYTIIVEAKKIGAAFPSPTKRKKLKLTGSILGQGEINEAILQAERYAKSKGADVVCVTNGNCWCLYPYSDQNDRNIVYAHVFFPLDSPDDAEEMFRLLSVAAVESDSLQNLSIEALPLVTSNSLINTVKDADARLGRNNVADLISPALDYALHGESLLGDEEKLSYCYVNTDTRTKYDNTLKVFLADKKVNPNLTAKRIKKSSKEDDLKLSLKNARPNKNTPVTLLIGEVGSGKSTYLSYFELIHARDLLREKKCLWINIDFEKMGKTGNPRSFIYTTLLEYLAKEHPYIQTDYESLIQPAYKEKIDGLKRGHMGLLVANKERFNEEVYKIISDEYNKVEPYVERLLAYIASNYLCVIALDNIDLYEDTKLEIEVFSEGVALAKKVSCNVLVSVRDTTYIKHRNESIFNAYELKKFWIDPPPFREVLSKRLTFAGSTLQEQKGTVEFNGMTLIIEDLSKFFEIAHSTLLKEKHARFIECISDGNIRKGIILVNNFLTSAHIQADRAIYNYLSKQVIKALPYHEVFKGSVLGQWKYYKEERAELVNIVNSGLNSIRLQLLKAYILKFLFLRAKDKNTLDTPFLKVFEQFTALGATENHIITVLSFLTQNRLVHPVDNKYITVESVVNITLAGSYYYKVLLGQFEYLENVMYDTPIFIDDHWEKIYSVNESVLNETDIVERFRLRKERIKFFYNYLVEIEKQSLSSIPNGAALAIFPEIKHGLIRQIKQAYKNAKSYYA